MDAGKSNEHKGGWERVRIHRMIPGYCRSAIGKAMALMELRWDDSSMGRCAARRCRKIMSVFKAVSLRITAMAEPSHSTTASHVRCCRPKG